MITVGDATAVVSEDRDKSPSQLWIHMNGCSYVIHLPDEMDQKEANKFAKDYTSIVRRIVEDVKTEIHSKIKEALGIHQSVPIIS